MIIKGDGPRGARLVLLAEKAGKDEVWEAIRTGQGRPLIGPSGKQVDSLLASIGLSRSDVYVRNVIEEVPDDEVSKLRNGYKDAISTPTNDQIAAALPSLYRDLSSLPNCTCIIGLGDIALRALSNFHLSGITTKRGSVYLTPWSVKFVPTYHPAFYMRGEWRFVPIVKFDFRRAAAEAEDPAYHHPERSHNIEPTFKEALDWLSYLDGASSLSFDIETTQRRFISCMAFAKDDRESFCIPFQRGNYSNYFTPYEEAALWRRIDEVLNREGTEYITQNGLFDCWHLWRHGIPCRFMDQGFDTMYAHRFLAPDLPHALDFLVSLYTDPVEPYYKDESGAWRDNERVKVPDHRFWMYNGKDAVCTWEVAQNLKADLAELDMLDYYRLYRQRKFSILLGMRIGGITVDLNELASVREGLITERESVAAKITRTIGRAVNVKSPIEMEALLKELSIVPFRTPTGRPKIDEDSILAYIDNASTPEAVGVLSNIREEAKARTLISQFLEIGITNDDRYHPSYDLSKAKTGREASGGADEGGPQLQNIPRRIRRIFVADRS